MDVDGAAHQLKQLSLSGWYVEGAFNITNGSWDNAEVTRITAGLVVSAAEVEVGVWSSAQRARITGFDNLQVIFPRQGALLSGRLRQLGSSWIFSDAKRDLRPCGFGVRPKPAGTTLGARFEQMKPSSLEREEMRRKRSKDSKMLYDALII